MRSFKGVALSWTIGRAGGDPVVGPTNGLVGWWKLDETSGTSAADSSGTGNTGTTHASPAWTTAGQFNGALTFNGTTQYVSVPDVASLQLSGSWTVSTWVNPSALPASGLYYGVLSKTNASSNMNYVLTVDNASGLFGAGAPKWVVEFNQSSGPVWYAADQTSISTGTWYHLAGVWDSSTHNLYLYLNGILVATQNTGANVPDSGSGNNLTIGSRGATHTAGTLDDTRIYNRALTASEVKQLYSATGGQ